MVGILYVVGTPIGNLEDVTLRALRILKEVDAIASEDTRTTQKLLNRYEIRKEVIAYFQHSGVGRTEAIVNRLASGASIALVTESGTPAVSDPGGKLVAEAHRRHIPVRVIPGPSSVAAAVSAAGFPVDRFRFEGFLPKKSGRRKKVLVTLAKEEKTLVFFESPYRVVETLREMTEILGDRQAVVAREMTKLHEEIRRGSLRELAEYYAATGSARGEFTLVVAGANPD